MTRLAKIHETMLSMRHVRLDAAVVFTTAVGLAIAAVNPLSVRSYLFFMGLTAVGYYTIFRRLDRTPFILYAGYSLAILILFLIQSLTLPTYYGFSGGLGVGTDDAFFYSQVATELPPDFPLRPNHLAAVHAYSAVMMAVTPFHIFHPLDILFFNAVAATFVPIFTRAVALRVTNDQHVGNASFLFAMVCPFLAANGLVLVRDGWTATLLIGSIYLFMQRRFILMSGTAALLFYLRVGTGALLLLALALLAHLLIREGAKSLAERVLFAFGLVVLLAVATAASTAIVVEEVVEEGLTDDFHRADFVDGFLAQNTDSTFLKIQQLPVILRVPVSFLYFIAAPFLNPSRFVVDGLLIPRNVLVAGIFPIMLIAYAYAFTAGISHALSSRHAGVATIVIIFLASTLLLSQGSLQLRHKTALMPLFYIVAAYGMQHARGIHHQVGMLGAAGLGLLSVVAAVGGLL